MCDTIKAAIIEDDDKLPKLLACSIYDTNPVHLLSTITEKFSLKRKNAG